MWDNNKIHALGIICLGFFLLNFNGSSAFSQVGGGQTEIVEEDQVLDKTILPYIQALQSGDVKTLQALIDGELAITLDKLLTENSSYPSFLRERFGQSPPRDLTVFREKVKKGFTKLGSAKGSVEVALARANASQVNLELSLEKNERGKWKVVAQRVVQ